MAVDGDFGGHGPRGRGEQLTIPHEARSRAEVEAAWELQIREAIEMSNEVDPTAKLSINQVAEFLSVSRRTVYNYADKGLLQIEHDRGKPFVRRRSIDAYLDGKNAGVRKTQYVPEGCVVVPQQAWDDTRQIATDLQARVQNLLTYQAQVQNATERAVQAEAEAEELKRRMATLEKRGWWARLTNKGA